MGRKVSLAMWFSLLSNIFLTLTKIAVGLISNSQVLIADGVHNAGDVVGVIAALSSTKIARQPADDDHPYGHGKAEAIASGIVGLILAFSALIMVYQSIESLFKPATEAHMLAFIAAVVSVLLKQSLYGYCMRVGKKVKSKSLIATAYDHLADIYASGAAVLGIGLGLIGDKYGLDYLMYGDPISGIIVSILVMKLAIHIGRDSTNSLMDKNLDEETIKHYSILINSIQEVRRIDRIRAREHGYYIIMDVRVSIPAELSIQEGHDISRRIKQVIMESDKNVKEVLIHLNPYYESGVY
jgi:cation diffusion facilitator family transporter